MVALATADLERWRRSASCFGRALRRESQVGREGASWRPFLGPKAAMVFGVPVLIVEQALAAVDFTDVTAAVDATTVLAAITALAGVKVGPGFAKWAYNKVIAWFKG